MIWSGCNPSCIFTDVTVKEDSRSLAVSQSQDGQEIFLFCESQNGTVIVLRSFPTDAPDINPWGWQDFSSSLSTLSVKDPLHAPFSSTSTGSQNHLAIFGGDMALTRGIDAARGLDIYNFNASDIMKCKSFDIAS